MKHFILALLAMLVSVSVSAQEINVKKYKNKTYYHIKYENGNERYAALRAYEQPTLRKLENMEARISKKKYEEVKGEETTFVIDRPTPSEMVSDTKTIEVASIQGLEISTSSKFQQGDNYKLFRVTNAKDAALVGCNVVCQILERRKSNISGSEGRLSLLPLYIDAPDGKVPLMPTPIHRRGLNKANVKFWTAIFIIPIFIPGTRAEIAQGETLTLRLE